MKKLMSILGAALFVFALTLSSCGGDADESTCKQDPKCENDAACKESTEEGCKGYVAPVVEEKVVEEEVVVEEEEVVVEEEVNNAGSEWDEFLDDYEDYVDKTISLMKKMKDNPTDMSVIGDYTKLSQDAMKWADKMDNASSADGFTAEHLERMNDLMMKAAKAAY